MGDQVLKMWVSHDFICEVRKIRDYHCGYVSVNEDHPLYGVDYCDLGRYVCIVNGGLTFSEKTGTGWTFGFDYAHCWNRSGYDVADVVNDCEALAAELAKVDEFTVEAEVCSKVDPVAVLVKGKRYEPARVRGSFLADLVELCMAYDVDLLGEPWVSDRHGNMPYRQITVRGRVGGAVGEDGKIAIYEGGRR